MGPAQVRPFIGKIVLPAVATVGAIFLIAGSRTPPPAATAPASPAVATTAPEQPQPDVHLASLQEAFAISKLGTMRPEVDDREPAQRPPADQKQRAAAKATKPTVIAAPLPPPGPASAAPQSQPAPDPKDKGSKLFGFVPKLPTPGEIVDKAASLGDKVVSLVRWR